MCRKNPALFVVSCNDSIEFVCELGTTQAQADEMARTWKNTYLIRNPQVRPEILHVHARAIDVLGYRQVVW